MASSNDLPLASAGLVWNITRTQNSFLRLGRADDGEQFSADPHNLVSLNRRKYSVGLPKTVGVSATLRKKKDNKVVRGVQLNLGTHSHSAKTKKVHLTLNRGHSQQVIRKTLAEHRPDLVRLAILRVHRLQKAAHRAYNAHHKAAAAPKKE